MGSWCGAGGSAASGGVSREYQMARPPRNSGSSAYGFCANPHPAARAKSGATRATNRIRAPNEVRDYIGRASWGS
jgi:hypothetical protein